MLDPLVVKEQTEIPTPLFLFDCVLANGERDFWSTHRVEIAGNTYQPRVLKQNRFELRAAADGVDSRSTLTLELANLDSHFSQRERSIGWKGAKVTVRLAFYDLFANAAVTDPVAIYTGAADPPSEISETRFILSFRSRLEFSRILLPQTRIQARCPWMFPATADDRARAVSGGTEGEYGAFYKCGYSADADEGAGNLNGGAAFTSCDYTKKSCQERGMFDRDSSGRETKRFGGIGFVPASVLVRSAGEKTFHTSETLDNGAKYNDFVPLVYGTAWHQPPVVFARNDGNLTHFEVLVGLGPIHAIQRVVVNDTEIPHGGSGVNMTQTGWYNICSNGYRNGAFNPGFTSDSGTPAGDPYGSMAYLSVVVPNRLSDGKSLPKVQVLVDGLRLLTYTGDGTEIAQVFTRNPAWILLDVLRRSGWTLAELDLASFARTAAYCDELIQVYDLNGQLVNTPRFEANLVLRRRKTAAEVLRGIRASAGLLLRLGAQGKLQLLAETTFAGQQSIRPAGSNSLEQVAGGWPAYDFGDGTNGYSGILRRESGEPTLRMWCRSTAETPNRYSVEFQDSFNGYQQDSVSVVDTEDALRVGQEISAPLPALGLPNYDQAARVTRFYLLRSIRGNEYLEFETSIRAMSLRPGDLIAMTYAKEGLLRAPYRILSMLPSLNFETVLIQAQRHEDFWFDVLADPSGSRSNDPSRAYRGMGTPRPLLGSSFQITEDATIGADGNGDVVLNVEFERPRAPGVQSLSAPLVSVVPEIRTGGTLPGGKTYWYAISGVTESGTESALSFLLEAETPETVSDNAVVLKDLWFSEACTSFRVYRGETPNLLGLIAEGSLPAVEFTDNGLTEGVAAPPDEHYDHANFYYRMELLPPTAVESATAVSVVSSALHVDDDALRGYVIRILEGTGTGQEMTITGNTGSELTVENWAILPDTTSVFSVAEPGWQIAGSTSTSQIRFAVPNRGGSVVQVQGRAANALDVESNPAAAPIVRWRIGGAAGEQLDADIPPKPVFGLHLDAGGALELSSIGFSTFENTRSVYAGTLGLLYLDELNPLPPTPLTSALNETETMVELAAAVPVQAGDLWQIEQELVQVVDVVEPTRIEVERAKYGTVAGAYASGQGIHRLEKRIMATSFPRDFFGSPASGAYSWRVPTGSWRLAAAEFYVTNSKGNSPTATQSYTSITDGGLRLLPGGQFTIQVPGNLAVQTNCAPPLIVDEPRAIRDIFATTFSAPQVWPVTMRLLVDDVPYVNLTVPAGETTSDVVNGFGLVPLAGGSRISLDILSVGESSGSEPGRDLTVTIRL